ncbi:MAG: calcium/sodium antiporter, partial [Candidatus Chisholmbacteria bacterium]|nr:calcium/sodium antiporter [Candidatus Chisholmbacteria bacterium]
MYSFALQLVLGIIILVVSTRVLIRLAVKISAFLKISPLIIGTTVVALGTSLPELAVSTVASARQDVGLAISIVGIVAGGVLVVTSVEGISSLTGYSTT